MGTLVLTPQAIYTAYLAGYLNVPAGDVVDTADLARDAPSPESVALLTAYSLGKYDADVQPPRALHRLVTDVQDQLAEQAPQTPSSPVTIERAVSAACAVRDLLGGSPPVMVEEMAAAIFKAFTAQPITSG